MKKIYNLILVMFCAMFIVFQPLTINTNIANLTSTNNVKTNKLTTNSDINEQDFINTVSLKSSFLKIKVILIILLILL